MSRSTASRAAVNLTWHITPDVMAYYTYSQGFRPGGFNRTIANKAKDANGETAVLVTVEL